MAGYRRQPGCPGRMFWDAVAPMRQKSIEDVAMRCESNVGKTTCGVVEQRGEVEGMSARRERARERSACRDTCQAEWRQSRWSIHACKTDVGVYHTETYAPNRLFIGLWGRLQRRGRRLEGVRMTPSRSRGCAWCNGESSKLAGG